MSTEPERHIEKQLKAYANKRRTEAGAPFELHPATRRLLHGEVARKTSRAPGGSLFLTKVFLQIWPRFAFVIPLIMLSLLVLVYKVLDYKHPLELANTVSTSTAQSDDEIGGKVLASGAVAEVSKVEGRFDRPASTPAELPQLKTALSDNQLAAAPQIAERKRVESLIGPAEKLSLEPPAALAQKQAVRSQSDADTVPTTTAESSTATVAVKPDAPSARASYLGKEFDRLHYDGSGAESATQRFAQISLAKNDPASKTLETNVVLTSFQMEQVGDQIRVIDKDGSTYAGHLQKVVTAPKQQITDGKDLINEARKSKALAKTPLSGTDGKSEVQTGQDYYFRVVGMNRSLRQQVIFSGHLLAEDSGAEVSNTNPNTTAAGQLQVPVQNQGKPPVLNSRINGTALIGGSNTVQIQAVPVAPR